MEIVNLQIQIFLLLAVGYILAKKNFLSKETRTQMTNIVLMVMLPCSIVMSFQIDLTDKVIQSTISVLFISICIQFFYGFLNKILYNRYSQDKKICLQYGTMVSNAGFMGMPIAQGVFGDIGLLYASVFLIPQRIFMWSSGLSLFTTVDRKNLWKQVMTHPCIIAIYFGVGVMIMKYFGLEMPMPLQTTLSSIGSCSTAMSMFVIGGILSDVDRQQLFDKEICLYSIYRLILIPVMIMIILWLLHLDILSSNVCILLSAMPAASTTVMLAQKYNQNAEFASRMVFISTLFSLITLPIMTLLFQWG